MYGNSDAVGRLKRSLNERIFLFFFFSIKVFFYKRSGPLKVYTNIQKGRQSVIKKKTGRLSVCTHKDRVKAGQVNRGDKNSEGKILNLRVIRIPTDWALAGIPIFTSQSSMEI